MKFRYLAAVALVTLVVVQARAQTHEFFGGISGGEVYVYVKGLGWTGSYAYNANDSFAIVAQGSGNYRTFGSTQTEDTDTGEILSGSETRLSSYTLGAGPRFRKGSGDVSVFAQALVGASLDKIAGYDLATDTETGATYLDQFAIMPGAGIDVRLTDNLQLRSAADLLLKRMPEIRTDTTVGTTNVTNAAWDAAFRLAFGIVVGF